MSDDPHLDPAQVKAVAEHVAPEVEHEVVGFLEESAGVRSSSRLAVFIVVGFIGAVIVCSCIYILRPEPSASVIGSIAGIVTALGGLGALVHAKRGEGD